MVISKVLRFPKDALHYFSSDERFVVLYTRAVLHFMVIGGFA